MRFSTASGSALAFVGRRTVDGGNFFSSQAQVDGKLTAMMCHVIEHSITDGNIARLLAQELACCEHAPLGIEEMAVGSALEDSTSLLQAGLKLIEKILACLPFDWFEFGSVDGIDVEF